MELLYNTEKKIEFKELLMPKDIPCLKKHRHLGTQNIDAHFADLVALLQNYENEIEYVLNIGCAAKLGTPPLLSNGIEPFLLHSALPVAKITVIEKNHQNIENFSKYVEFLSRSCPFEDFSKIEVIQGDITNPIPELRENSFDLIYCQRVLTNLTSVKASDVEIKNAITLALTEISRVLRHNGYFVSSEWDLKELNNTAETSLVGQGENLDTHKYPIGLVTICEQAGFSKLGRFLVRDDPYNATEYIIYRLAKPS